MIIARSRSPISISGSMSDWPSSRLLNSSKTRRLCRAGEIDRDQVDAPLLQRSAPVGLRMEIVVDQRKAHLGVAENVIHVGGTEHGVDRYPDEARAVDAEQRFDELTELLQIVEIFSPGFRPRATR